MLIRRRYCTSVRTRTGGGYTAMYLYILAGACKLAVGVQYTLYESGDTDILFWHECRYGTSNTVLVQKVLSTRVRVHSLLFSFFLSLSSLIKLLVSNSGSTVLSTSTVLVLWNNGIY